VHTPQTPNSLSTDHSIQNSTFAKNNQKTEIKNITPQFSYHFQGKTKKQKSENQNSPPITTISPSTHTNSPQHTPDEIFVSTINQIFSLDISSFLNKGNKVLFRFEYTPEMAQHNALILDAFDFNLYAAILAQKNSQAFYGSEFRNPDLLSRIFKNHPLWKYMNEILNHGAFLSPRTNTKRNSGRGPRVSQTQRQSQVSYKILQCNHIKEDVERGFALILSIQTLKRIKNVSLAPLGCIKQNTIGNDGSRTHKFRLTHDHSFPGPSGTSVNLRTIHDNLPPIVYGFCLKHIIQYILNLRLHNPSSKIFISKFDFDAAYRRCHMSAATAQESLTIHNNFLLMALWLTFGGLPCPNLWGCLSESITDLSNMLIQNNYWNHTKLFDPLVNSLNEPVSLPADIPFAQTKSLSISIPTNNIGKSDVFIDDIIAISLDNDDNIRRVCSAVLLAIHTVARPLDSQDEIPRKEIILLKKFQAKGSPSEQKVVLGWHFDTRGLRIHLPRDKFNEWNKDINSCLSQ